MPDRQQTIIDTPAFLSVENNTKDVFTAFLFVFLPVTLVFEAMIIHGVVSEYYKTPEQCWSIEKIDNVYVKLNQCSGESFIIGPEKSKP